MPVDDMRLRTSTALGCVRAGIAGFGREFGGIDGAGVAAEDLELRDGMSVDAGGGMEDAALGRRFNASMALIRGRAGVGSETGVDEGGMFGARSSENEVPPSVGCDMDVC